MTAPAAITGNFADFKIVRGRKVAQFVIEVPIETADVALVALGGLPNPASETPVALARLNPTAITTSDAQPEAMPQERRRFKELPPAQQAGMACQSEAFQRFLNEKFGIVMNEQSASEHVRKWCGVTTRSEIKDDNKSGASWRSLYDRFIAWKTVDA